MPLSALDLGRRLAALPEPAMRRFALFETLAGLPDSEVIGLLGELIRLGRREASCEVAVITLAVVLDGGDLGYERHAALYEEAQRQDDEVVARLLLTGGRQPGASRRREPSLYEPTAPLGWRKAWARQGRRDRLDRLLHDPAPEVLEILLGNPKVVERDAVTLAARRPTTAATQRVVFHSRYGCRQEVRRALAFNPYTPVEMSVRILPGLCLQDIVEVSGSLELASSLRDAADAILRERSSS